MNFTTPDCGDHGIYVKETNMCDCDVCFFGNFCTEKGKDMWGQGWLAFQYITFCLYLIITIITWCQFYKNVKKVFSF